MAKMDDTTSVLFIIIFIIVALIFSHFMFAEKEVTVTTHGVQICNENYDCGEEDGISPEDFGAYCIIKDPDCQ